MNLKIFFQKFGTEDACRTYLEQQRWEGTPKCHHCGSTKLYRIESNKRFKCSGCSKKFSVLTGTPLENSKLPLTTWVAAIYIISTHKKGISSTQLAAHLGITQKSAWFMLHRMRKFLVQEQEVVLGKKAEVEGDVTWVGGKVRFKSNKKRYEYSKHRDWRIGKVPVLGLIERGGTVMLRAVKREGDEVELIRKHTELYATLITDDAQHYIQLKDNYYHYKVAHGLNEYGRWKFNTNTVEGLFAHLKRMCKGTYHYVSPKHIQSYLDEFTYRHNFRLLSNEERFNLVFKGTPGKLTYKMLVHGENKENRGSEA